MLYVVFIPKFYIFINYPVFVAVPPGLYNKYIILLLLGPTEFKLLYYTNYWLLFIDEFIVNVSEFEDPILKFFMNILLLEQSIFINI